MLRYDTSISGRIQQLLPRKVLSISAVAAGLAGCAGSAPADFVGMQYGEAVALGEGTVRSYVLIEDGAPVEVGVALSEAALAGLPGHGGPGAIPMPDGNSTYEFELQLPATNPTPFQHVTVDWNPGGHEPPGIYDSPHFDVHFYTISSEARRTIHPGDPQFGEKAARHPSAEYVPSGYAALVPDAVPMMGLHWFDPASPELNGSEFTRTFIYGSWDGQMIFLEPMITRAFLETKPDFTAPIPVAAQHAVPGYYPGRYSVRWDEASREYRIALGDLARRN